MATTRHTEAADDHEKEQGEIAAHLAANPRLLRARSAGRPGGAGLGSSKSAVLAKMKELLCPGEAPLGRGVR
jgi:hypothetical protein